jgi:hypothetical protein
LDEVVTGDFFGGYVRYRYDELDEIHSPNTPIFSRAYLFNGTDIEYQDMIDDLIAAYPDHRFEETQNADYFRIKGQMVSVSKFTTDLGETVISISHQDVPQE